MKFLVVGLGSMGKRRIRNLHTLNFSQIAGFDLRNDRVEEAVNKYQIIPFSDFNQAINYKFILFVCLFWCYHKFF